MTETHQDEIVSRVNAQLPAVLAISTKDIRQWAWDLRTKIIPEKFKVPNKGDYWYDGLVDLLVRAREIHSHGLKWKDVQRLLKLEEKTGLFAILCRDCGTHLAFSETKTEAHVCKECQNNVSYRHAA